MRRRRPSYDQINQQMRGKLPTFLETQRDNKGWTWLAIAREIERRTGLVVDRETVRRWHYAQTHETTNGRATP